MIFIKCSGLDIRIHCLCLKLILRGIREDLLNLRMRDLKSDEVASAQVLESFDMSIIVYFYGKKLYIYI